MVFRGVPRVPVTAAPALLGEPQHQEFAVAVEVVVIEVQLRRPAALPEPTQGWRRSFWTSSGCASKFLARALYITLKTLGSAPISDE